MTATTRLSALLVLAALTAAASAQQPITLKGHKGWVGGVAFSPDGETLATAAADGTVKLWHVGSGEVRRTLAGHKGHVTTVAFAPDGQTLATGGFDRAVRLWNVADGRQTKLLRGGIGEVLDVDWSPDGRLLASGAAGKLRLFSSALEPAAMSPELGDWVHGACFLGPDRVAAVTHLGGVHRLDAATLKPAATAAP